MWRKRKWHLGRKEDEEKCREKYFRKSPRVQSNVWILMERTVITMHEFEPSSKTSPVRFFEEYEVMRAPRYVPLREVEPVIQMIPDSNPARGNVVDSTHDKYLLGLHD